MNKEELDKIREKISWSGYSRDDSVIVISKLLDEIDRLTK